MFLFLTDFELFCRGASHSFLTIFSLYMNDFLSVENHNLLHGLGC